MTVQFGLTSNFNRSLSIWSNYKTFQGVLESRSIESTHLVQQIITTGLLLNQKWLRLAAEKLLLRWNDTTKLIFYSNKKIIEIHFLWFHRKLARLSVFENLQKGYFRFGPGKNWFLTRLLICVIFWENWWHILSLNLTFLFDLEQVWNISKDCTEWRKSNARERWRSERLYLSAYLMQDLKYWNYLVTYLHHS